MIKALKILVIIWAALGILMGLWMIFAPEQLAEMQGYEQGPEYVLYLLASLGVFLIVSKAFIIVAVTRDLLKNILWVQMAIALAIFMVAVGVYSICRGFVTFEQAGVGTIIEAVFAVAFLALYPWRGARE